MTNFDILKKREILMGATASHQFRSAIPLRDSVESYDVLVVPKNVTVFTMPVRGSEAEVEYFFCAGVRTRNLKRVFAAWFTRPDSKGTMIDSMGDYVTLDDFFAANEGRLFQVIIDEDPTHPMPNGKPMKKYTLDWYDPQAL